MKFLYNVQLYRVWGWSDGHQNGRSDSFFTPAILPGLGCCEGLSGARGIYSNQNLVCGTPTAAVQSWLWDRPIRSLTHARAVLFRCSQVLGLSVFHSLADYVDPALCLLSDSSWWHLGKLKNMVGKEAWHYLCSCLLKLSQATVSHPQAPNQIPVCLTYWLLSPADS